MHKSTSMNLQKSPSRKRVRLLLPVVNPSNQNEENNCKRRKLDLQKSNENFTINSKVTSLTSLNDDVLLHVFRYLNWKDSMNLAASCNRLQQIKYLWTDKRDQKFNLDEYVDMINNLPKTMLPAIAPNITVLETSTSTLNKRIMELCSNIKSLKINFDIGRSDARKINAWIKKSNVKSFSFSVCDDINTLLAGVNGLQELEISYLHQNIEYIIQNNTNLERLSVELDTQYNFRSFQKLQALQSLHIRCSDFAPLGEIQKFGHLEELTQLSVQCDAFSDDMFYSFIDHIVKRSKLDKLQLVNCFIDDNMFDKMKLLNLSALSLWCDYSAQGIIDFVLANTSSRMKHLKLSSCSSEELLILIENWTSLETVCLYVDEDELNEILDSSFINKILETSRTRSLLRLHLVAKYDSGLDVNCEIFINFLEQQLKVAKHKDGFCCSTSKSFNFSTRDCFLHEY